MKGAFKSRTPQIEYTLGGWRVTGKVDGLHAGYIAAAQAKVGKVHWWYAWRACLHITNRVSTQRNTVLHVESSLAYYHPVSDKRNKVLRSDKVSRVQFLSQIWI